jgi:predicted ATPase
VAAALEGRVRLLVLDNCEHVLDATADLVETILAHSATVKILATSREGLGVQDEQLWPVQSLDVAAGSASAAFTLFVERARSVAPNASFAKSDEVGAVVEICERLDGIPLAIELAASRMASMTASDVRARLDQRFRLLVGSRRGLERHQTLHHAVAWSYDLLDNAEKALLDRCSVFAGGFDLESACAVAGSDDADEFAILDLLDALVRKSLIVADRSSANARYSMLETIRQFAEEQLVACGAATEVRAAHAHYFAGREADILALWDSPRQREAYDWFAVELANLRSAFRWAADTADLDVASAIATYAGFLGLAVENLESLAWAEELVEPAALADHARLGAVAAMASNCWMTGRIDDAVRYREYAEKAISRSHVAELPFRMDTLLGGAFLTGGQPDRAIDWYRTQLARGRDTHTLARLGIVLALMVGGRGDEALVAADGLVTAAEAKENPYVISFALFACGYALSATAPATALAGFRRGLVIAHDSGNRANASHLTACVSRLEAASGDPLDALDVITTAIRNYHDCGNTTNMRNALATLATLLHRLRRHQPAATLTGFAITPFISATYPEIDTAISGLREVLGVETYESLAGQGASMTHAAIANYAYDQIDQARAALAAEH